MGVALLLSKADYTLERAINKNSDIPCLDFEPATKWTWSEHFTLSLC